MNFNPKLHVISTGKQTPSEFTEKVCSIHSVIDYVHIREQSWTADDHIQVIHKLVRKGVSSKKIIINDRLDIAVTEQVGGVQLPAHSIAVQKAKKFFPHIKMGCSVHSVEEGIDRESKGADFLLYGHIFNTPSKIGSPPRGLGKLQQVCTSVDIPVIAIGGITPGKIQSVIEAGASGIAVLSGILLDNDSLNAALKYRAQLNIHEEVEK